jgi:hypothetical protein
VFSPDMVLNQRQVLVIVSDWEPYLGSLFCVGFLWVIVPVFVAPDRTVSVFHVSYNVLYIVQVIIFIKDV